MLPMHLVSRVWAVDPHPDHKRLWEGGIWFYCFSSCGETQVGVPEIRGCLIKEGVSTLSAITKEPCPREVLSSRNSQSPAVELEIHERILNMLHNCNLFLRFFLVGHPFPWWGPWLQKPVFLFSLVVSHLTVPSRPGF